jgi:hypothetical protein
MEQFISAICVLGLVTVGLLIITRRISLEEAGNLILKAFLSVIAILTLICLAKKSLAAAIGAALAGLETGIGWLSLITFVLILVFVFWGPRTGNRARASGRRTNHGGDL